MCINTFQCIILQFINYQFCTCVPGHSVDGYEDFPIFIRCFRWMQSISNDCLCLTRDL